MNRAGHLWTSSDTPPSLARVVAASSVLAVALCVAGVLYAVLTYINPIVYVGFVITIGFGFVAAYAAIAALRYTRVYSLGIVLPVVFVVPLLAHYVGWVAWVFLVMLFLSDAGFLGAAWTALYPPALFEAVGQINAVGTWTVTRLGGSAAGRGAVHGTMLWVTWAIEALLVVGVGWVYGFVDRERRWVPICDACDAEVVEELEVLRLGVTSEQARALAERVRALDLTALEAFSNVPSGSSWAQFDLAVCGCGSTRTLTMSFVQVGMGDKHVEPLVSFMGLDEEHVKFVRALASRATAVQVHSFVSTPFGA